MYVMGEGGEFGKFNESVPFHQTKTIQTFALCIMK